MYKNRSLGIIVAGWILIIFGLVGFQNNVLGNFIFIRDTPIFTYMLESYVHNFPSFKTSGVPSNEIANILILITSRVLSDNPYLIIVNFLVNPLLWFLLFLSGIGILHLRNDWRITSMIICPVLVFLNIANQAFISLYLAVIIVTGKVIAARNGDVFNEAIRTAKFSTEIFIKNIFSSLLLTSVLILFLTRARVIKQFKSQKEKDAA